MVIVDDGSDDATPGRRRGGRPPRRPDQAAAPRTLRRLGRTQRRRRGGPRPLRGLAGLRQHLAAAVPGGHGPRAVRRRVTGRLLRLHLRHRQRCQYREFAGALEHLAIGNFVDLNVLVVERDLLTEVGGFDPTLPRAVDYDLVYRIARGSTLSTCRSWAPIYADDADDPAPDQRQGAEDLELRGPGPAHGGLGPLARSRRPIASRAGSA